MPGIMTDLGNKELLGIALGHDSTTTYQLKLFTNDYTPDCSSDATSDYTECTFGGYAPASVYGTNFSYSTPDGCKAVWTNIPIVYSFSSGGTLYGYYVINNNTGNVVWASRFTSPIDIPDPDGAVWTLTISLGGLTCS